MQIFHHDTVPYISTNRLYKSQLSFLSHFFIHFLSLYHHLQYFVFELMNIKGMTIFQNTVQESLISIKFKIQQKSVTDWFTSTKAPNNDKVLDRHIHKNYSIIQIILNVKWILLAQVPAKSNKSGQIFTNQKYFCIHSQELSYFFYKKFSQLHCCSKDVKLQSWKVINNQKISWKPPFLNYHIKEYDS